VIWCARCGGALSNRGADRGADRGTDRGTDRGAAPAVDGDAPPAVDGDAAPAAARGGHEACAAALALEPPRFCPRCRRRMKVQVLPTGWVATCVEHGRTQG